MYCISLFIVFVLDTRCYELECDLNLTRQRFEAKQEETQRLEEKITEQNRVNGELGEKLTSLEETSHSVKLENGSLKREREQIIGQYIN